MVRKLDGCEVGASVTTALEEAGHFRVDKFMHSYPLGPAKEVVLVGMVFEDDFCSKSGLCLNSSRYEIHLMPEGRCGGKLAGFLATGVVLSKAQSSRIIVSSIK